MLKPPHIALIIKWMSLMSKREDILDTSRLSSEHGIRSGLLYSEVLGWIDMGHARGDDIRDLMAKFSIGESSGEAYYQVRYQQTMGFGRFSTGRFDIWQVKKGRTLQEKRSIALAMLMRTAAAFENWQSTPFFSWYRQRIQWRGSHFRFIRFLSH